MSKEEEGKDKGRKQHEMPLRYLITGVLILTLFVAAIVLPDVLPYLFPSRGAATAGAGVTPIFPAATPGPTSPTPAAAVSQVAGQLFEGYARLVTLFIGVASVLGLFFGYFVRKSIRETEEDVDKRFDRNFALWEKERTTLLDQYKTDAATLKEQIEVSKNLEQKMRSDMQELTDALESHRNNPASSEPPVSETTAQVDKQLGDL